MAKPRPSKPRSTVDNTKVACEIQPVSEIQPIDAIVPETPQTTTQVLFIST